MNDEHRTICAVDIAGFGSVQRTRPNYVTIRHGLVESMKQAFKEADIPWSECFHENTGDGRLILAPASVPKAHFAAVLPHAMDDALRLYNDERTDKEQIKLRLALHAGEVTADSQGFAGTAVTVAFRLLNAMQLKAAMSGSLATLGVIASDWFFDDVIRHRPEHEPHTYHKVMVETKEMNGAGWIRLVDHDVPAGALEPVAHGAVVVTPTLRPATPQFYKVVDALEEIPSLQTEHSRSLVLEQLSFAGSVTYFPNRRAHLTSIFRSCFDYEDGITQLVTAVANLESTGSIPVKRLLALLTGGIG